MATSASFLAGAKSRLLPASIPFRFFGAATLFHCLAWVALFAGADELPGFAGGLGAPLAALHGVTLGVLVMTAIGASLQLLPVATRQPLASPLGPRRVWWLYLPGVSALIAGMAWSLPALLAGGALAVIAALMGYAVLIARNLLVAKGMPAVVLHGWIAIAALGLTLASALSLAGAYVGWPGLDRATAMHLHVAFAVYGFMVMLLTGFSHILLPMFALADAPAGRAALLPARLAIVALLLAGAAAFAPAAVPLRIVAVLLGGAAFALHVATMVRVLRGGMRRNLGRPLRLMQLGWAAIAASLIAALGMLLDAPFARLPALFGVLLVIGLLSFLLGVLERIVPFLASMHAGAGRRSPPLPSALTAKRPLLIHYVCHLAACALLLAGVAAGHAGLLRAAALIGTAGAVAFAVFFATAWRRI